MDSSTGNARMISFRKFPGYLSAMIELLYSSQEHKESKAEQEAQSSAYLGWSPLTLLTFLQDLHPCYHHFDRLLVCYVVFPVFSRYF